MKWKVLVWCEEGILNILHWKSLKDVLVNLRSCYISNVYHLKKRMTVLFGCHLFNRVKPPTKHLLGHSGNGEELAANNWWDTCWWILEAHGCMLSISINQYYANIFPMMLGMDPVYALSATSTPLGFQPITSHVTRFHKMMTSIVEQYEGTVGNLAVQKMFKSGWWLSNQSMHYCGRCLNWKLGRYLRYQVTLPVLVEIFRYRRNDPQLETRSLYG